MSDTSPLLISDLLINIEEAGSLLSQAIRSGSWLDAFFLAAGVQQVVDDYLHLDLAMIEKTARFLARPDLPMGRELGWIPDRLYEGLFPWTSLLPQKARLVHAQLALAGFVQHLVGVVANLEAPQAACWLDVGQAILKEIRLCMPAGLPEVLHLPSSFRSFDQQPEDMQRLAQKFKERWTDLQRPLAVMGIRTSGSYLAPLLAAFLQAAGFRTVHSWTMRPAQGFLRHEQSAIRALRRQNGLLLLTDDPPITGATLLSSIERLENAAFPRSSVILMLQVFSAEPVLPPALQSCPAVVLPMPEWTIQARLAPQAVQTTLAEFWQGQFEIESVERLALPEVPAERGHVSALYRLELIDCHSHERLARDVFVKGAGLGYFGEHTLAIEQALTGFLPRVYGYRDGLLYREWLPEEARLARHLEHQEAFYANHLAGYVASRRRRLPARRDASQQLKGANSTWEVASHLLSQPFGRAQPLAQRALTDRVAKRLLEVRHPAIIDGKMDMENWFVDLTDHKAPVKIGYSERDFSHLDLACYDPVYDLASLAVSHQQTSFAESLRRAYQQSAEERVDPERWLLYQWVHLWDQQRQSKATAGAENRAPARLFQRYFSELYFNELELADVGYLCAIDLDGVLETHPFGFPQLTPASALALRALILHGFRPVLSTGRSIDEVRERCQAYHLVGGVAEYGAVIYNHLTGKIDSLLTYSEQEALNQLRLALVDTPGIVLDPDYQYAVRAFHLAPAGKRTGLDPAVTTQVLAKVHRQLPVQVIIGKSQTDFMAKRINKKVGLRRLLIDLDPQLGEAPTPLVFAVGDSVADLPMFDLAARAFMPAHASPDLARSNIQRLKGTYQVGFNQAAAAMLNHAPGSCSLCRWEPESPESRLFIEFLASNEGSPPDRALQTLKLALQMKAG